MAPLARGQRIELLGVPGGERRSVIVTESTEEFVHEAPRVLSPDGTRIEGALHVSRDSCSIGRPEDDDVGLRITEDDDIFHNVQNMISDATQASGNATRRFNYKSV